MCSFKKFKYKSIQKFNFLHFSIMNEKQKILFAHRYQSRCWFYNDRGSFITSDGCIYDFDFSSGPIHQNLDDALLNVLRTQKPSKQADKDEILKAYELVGKIDESAKMMLMPSADDAGEASLIAFYNGKKIRLTTIGDNLGFVDCPVVDEILDILEKINFYTWEFSFGEKYRVSILSKAWKSQSAIPPMITDIYY